MKAKASATQLRDKIQMDIEMSAAALAQRNTEEALQLLDAAAKTAGAQLFDVASIPMLRATVLGFSGRPRESLAPIAESLALADSGELPPNLSRNLRRQTLRARVVAEADLGDAAAARMTSAALDQMATSQVADANAQSAMHFGRGMLAMAAGDLAAARMHFDQCSLEDEACKWQDFLAVEKSGDKARMSAARDAILRLYRRTTVHLVVRSRLAPSSSTS